MSTEQVQTLINLHTTLIDTRNGYGAAQKDAEGMGLATLFRDLSVMHTKAANEVSNLLNAMGVITADEGSFMTTIHKTIVGIRSLFGGLDESIVPALVEGEMRVLGYYDDALQLFPSGHEREILVQQRTILAARIEDLESRKTMAA